MRKSVLVMAGMLALVLAGSAQAATMFAVQNAGAVDQMVVTDTGFIGVGTSIPNSGINVVGVPGNATQIINRTVGVDSAFGGGGFMGYHNNATVNGGLPQQGDRLGYILFGSYDGATAHNGAGVVAKAEEAWVAGGAGTGKNGTYFAFETTPKGVAGSRVERLRIAADGNVGIGTTGTPTSKLQVVGIPVFPNNAAAVAGLLTPGAFYRTGADPDVLCIVH